MSRKIGFVCAALALFLPLSISAGPQCRRCDIVQEGLLNDGLVGQYVYEQGESGRFHREMVVKVRQYPPAIYRQIPDGYYWQDASHFYSEASMNEIVADAGGGQAPYQRTTADDQEKLTVQTSCAAFEKARENGDLFTAYLMERACCESSAARRQGISKYCPGQ